jgi:IS5 family transposase
VGDKLKSPAKHTKTTDKHRNGQQWFGLREEELERQATDRISFQRFFRYLDPVPDSTTNWLFWERRAETGKDRLIWVELQRQLDVKGLGEGKEAA